MPILLAEERLGTRVAGRYRLDRIRRKGGMGVLYESFDEETSARVAVKMLKADYSLEAHQVARFNRETKLAASIRHPNIATVLDGGMKDADAPFLVMELLEGRTLAELLEQRARLSLEEALAIAIPIADALSAAHRAGIVHRDLKPSNVFLCGSIEGPWTPKLIDFGIAKGRLDDFETQSGMLLGTPGYMAPEQALHGECFSATDVWALGALLYRALTGAAPHAAGSVPEMLARVVREPVPALSAPGVGRRAGATIDRALAMDPCQRYPEMAAFADALRALSAEPTDDDPATLVEPVFDARPLSVEDPKSVTLADAAGAPRRRAFTARRIGGAALGGAFALIGVLALAPRPAPSAGAPERPRPTPRTAPKESRREITGAATFGDNAVAVRENVGPVANERASPNDGAMKGKRPASASSERSRESTAPRPRAEGPRAEEQPENREPVASPAQRTEPERKTDRVRDPGTGLSIATEW